MGAAARRRALPRLTGAPSRRVSSRIALGRPPRRLSRVSVNAPYRADIVGSFLRPEALKVARAAFADGDLDAAALRETEDHQIADLVRKQAENGLALATDGEFRRSWWHFDFFDGLDGVSIIDTDHGLPFQGVQTRQKAVQVNGRIGFDAHPHVEHAASLLPLAEAAGVQAKASIPSPTVLDFRVEPQNIVGGYGGRDEYVDDLVEAYRAAVRAYYDAGIRYLQFDDTAWAYLCSDVELERARTERGIDTDRLGERYASILNRVLEGKPDDLTVTTHICRGNFRSTWISSGGYEPIAEQLFGVAYDGFFLEFDDERSGASSRCGSCRRVTRPSSSASSRPSAARSRTSARSRAASTRPRRSRRSSSSPSARSAASPRPRRATCSPRTSSGRRSARSCRSPTRSGSRAARRSLSDERSEEPKRSGRPAACRRLEVRTVSTRFARSTNKSVSGSSSCRSRSPRRRRRSGSRPSRRARSRSRRRRAAARTARGWCRRSR